MVSWVILLPLTVFVASLSLSVNAAGGGTPSDPRGPIVNRNMRVAIVPDEGVQTKGYAFVNNVTKPDPWQAQWIWSPPDTPPSAATTAASGAIFRKEVDLATAPIQVRAWISAEIVYRLYINGRLAARGPVDNGRDYNHTTSGKWFYDYCDLSEFFHAGKNVLAVEVFTKGIVWSGWTTGHPGFLFEAQASFSAPPGITATSPLRTTLITSDPSWRCHPLDYWIDPKEGPQYLGGREPMNASPVGSMGRNWRDAGFNDAAWPAAVSVNDVWRKIPFVASEIPPRMEIRYPVMSVDRATPGVEVPANPFAPGTKQGIIFTRDGSCAIRYDRVLSAYLGLQIKGGGGGAILTIEPNETNTPGHNRVATCVLGPGETIFELPFMDSFSTINLTLKGVTTPVEIGDVNAVFTSQPVEYQGRFECSDAQLNKLWVAGRWATQICMQTHHLDSPHHQEPISDPGDYLIEAQVNYCTFGAPWLPRQDLRKFAWILERCKYHNFHTSYSLLWLQMLLEYYDYTGDQALLAELAPQVYGLLDTYTSWRGTGGLISEAPNYMFMDWVKIAGFDCHHPPAVLGQGYLTAFYYRGLEDAGRVAARLGDQPRVARYAALRREVAAAFNRELWSAKAGLYRDGKPHVTHVQPGAWLPADTDIQTFSTQVNSLAVAYGLAGDSSDPAVPDVAPRPVAIMEKLLARPDLNAQPYFMHFVFEALGGAGRATYNKFATAQLRRWEIHPEAQVAHEMWNTGDLSHGWGATPLIQMSRRILGVQIARLSPLGKVDELRSDPAVNVPLICPEPCDLTWARGMVPTPSGNMEVSWKLEDGTFTISVIIPTRTLLVLPPGVLAAGSIVLRDGKVIPGIPPSVIHLIGHSSMERFIDLEPGHHEIVARPAK